AQPCRDCCPRVWPACSRRLSGGPRGDSVGRASQGGRDDGGSAHSGLTPLCALTRGDEIDEDPDNQHVESSPITDDRMGSGGYAGRILMSKQQLKHKTRNGSPAFDRRTMLRYTVGGGVALAATTIGGLRGEAALAPGQTPSGAPPVPAKTVRRVVTGHNREGKSYIV